MGTSALISNKCRHIPGWVRPFLAAVKNGYSEKNAAHMAGISTEHIRQYGESNPEFVGTLEHNIANAAKRHDSSW
jgi:hypothetical protein